MTNIRLGFFVAALCTTAASPGYLRRTANMTEARASHTITLLADGRAFVAGGFAGDDREAFPFHTTEFFDPSTNRFTRGPDMSQGRSGHTATLLSDGRVFIMGGWTDAAGTFGTAEIDDPSGSRAPQTLAPITARAAHTATTLRDGRILIVGGVDRNDVELASAELFDPKTGKFAPAGEMSVARAAHTATLLGDGRVAIVGGSNGRYPNMNVQRSVEVYDPATNRFSVAGALHVARQKHGAVLLEDGRVLVVGGSDNRDWRGRYDSAEIFDATTGNSTAVSGMNARRFKFPHAVLKLSPGRVLIAGGGAEAEIFDEELGRFYRTDGSFGDPLFYSAAIVLRDGRALITGGYSEGGTLPATRSAFTFATQ
jgi:N-acetylneuraminic acid mutarotase